LSHFLLSQETRQTRLRLNFNRWDKRAMANRRNKAGQSARHISDKLYLKRAAVTIAGLLGLYICLKLLPSASSAGIGSIFILIVVMKLIAKMTGTKAKQYRKFERKAERGAKAEETVDNLLSILGDQFDVFHDIDTGHGDVDHIVISREHGIFVIETKSHVGKVTIQNDILLIDGKPPEKDFITQTIRNTMWLKQQIKDKTGLDTWIQPIIVFTRAFVRDWKPVRGILIRNQKYLLNTIHKTSSNQNTSAMLWKLHEQGHSLW
jgi:hypothetical protein